MYKQTRLLSQFTQCVHSLDGPALPMVAGLPEDRTVKPAGRQKADPSRYYELFIQSTVDVAEPGGHVCAQANSQINDHENEHVPHAAKLESQVDSSTSEHLK